MASKRFLFTVAALILANIQDAAAAAGDAQETSGTYAPEIGEWRQLFVDDYRIESLEDVERKLHVGIKNSEPVLQPEMPWEEDAAYLYGTVLFDEQEQVYKMWYQTFHPLKNDMYICYATSRDGQNWHKPELGIVEWSGSNANNIVLRGEIGTVVVDDKTTDPQRRYKMFGFRRPHYDAFFSADGIHWTQTEREYVLREGDVANVGWDPYQSNFYVLAKLPHPSGRTTFLSRSTDFENWTTGVPVMIADERDQAMAKLERANKMEIYGMSASPYEGGFIGFPWMFRVTGKGAKDTGGDGNIDVQFAYSRDLTNWARPIREAIIPNGTAGSFDDEMVFTSSAPVIRGDDVIMYYGAWDGPHGTFDRSAYIGRTVWKRDRFVSLANGGFTTGTVITKPILFSGTGLYVNADMSHGKLRAELLDSGNNVISGFELSSSIPTSGDQMEAELRWKSDVRLAQLQGKLVRIRFVLNGGELFSFWQGKQ